MPSEPTDFCRLWLFRHPELDAGQQAHAVGAGPAELSRRGRARVLQWIGRLDGVDVAGVHCSPQPQCHDPARAVAQAHHIEAEPDARLRDQEMGDWQGQAWQQIAQQDQEGARRFFAEFGEARAPRGESLGEAVERVLAFWAGLAPAAAGQNRVLVLPGSLLSGFTAAMLGMRLSRCISLNLPHGGLGVLDVFQNGVRIAAWNPDGLDS